ncbi:MAG: tetratricopeptide repeat protein [Pseudomonadota bacterium]
MKIRNGYRYTLLICLAVFAVDGHAARGEMLATAERALTDGDYAKGVVAYVEAAQNSDNIETARQATLTAYEFGFDSLTTQAAQRWATLDANTSEPGLYEAMAVLRSGDRDASLKLWRAAVERAGNAESVCNFFSEVTAADVRADDAAWLFDKLAARFRDSACLGYRAASAAASANDADAANEWLDRLQTMDAFDDDARLLRIALLIDDEKAEDAFTDEALFLSGEASIEQQVQLALLNARAEDIENAVNMLDFLSMQSPDDPAVQEAIALVKLQDGDLEGSRSAFMSLLESGEKTGSAMYYLARFAEGQRRTDQALRLYTQIDFGEFVLDAQQRAAFLLNGREGFVSAIDHLEGFSNRNPRYGLDLSLMRASLYAQNEFYDQALELYASYLEVKPRAEFAQLGQADTYLRSGDLDTAIAVFRGVVDMYPESANALNSLGYTLADRTRKLREAERLIDKALELDPENPAIIDSKGWVLFRRGKLKQSREYLEKAYEQFPDAEVAAHLGEVMWRMGDEEEARELLEEAYRRDPQDETLRETVRRLMESGPATRS